MCYVFLSIILSTRLFSEPMDQTPKADDEPKTEVLLEQKRPPPLNLDKQASDGKIVRKGALVEWQGKRGNVEITIGAENTDPHCQWQAEWEKNHSELFEGKASDSKKRSGERKNLGPSVSFTLSGSWDD